LRTVVSVIEPLPWWRDDRMPLTAAMSTASPVECWEMLPDAVSQAMAALHRGDGRGAGRSGEVLERREDAAVDRAGADVVAAAGVDVDARVGEHAALEGLLAHQQDLADRRRVGVGAEERVLALAR
jgi:hypothetical protein